MTKTIAQRDICVSLENVGLKYTVSSYKADTLRERIAKGLIFGRGKRRDLWAIDDISMNFSRGEVVGIIGENGSGKSTLLKIIGGILKPDKGTISTYGSIGAILQLGVGFQRDLTGRENIFLNSAMLGIENATIAERMETIIRFAELEEFIDMPLKTYSSGMEMRLGFSIAVNVNPDILLIDEVLIIGDEAFQKKCFQKIEEFKQEGKTIIIVSHTMTLITQLCDRAILLRKGNVLCSGLPRDVVHYYYQCAGLRDGITVLSREGEDFIFNNGRLFIFKDKKSLTPDPAIYLSCVIDNVHYHSFNAEWKIINKDDCSFSAGGEIPSREISFVINVERNEKGQLDVQYAVSSKRDMFENVACIVQIDKEYQRYFHDLASGSFDAAMHTQAQEIYRSVHSLDSVLGIIPPQDNTSIPPIAFYYEKADTITIDSIQGRERGYAINAMHIRKKVRDVTGRMRLAFYDSAQTILDSVSQKRADRTISAENTSAFFGLESIDIFYGGKQLTCGKGVYTTFNYDNAWLHSANFEWQYEKVSSSIMRMSGIHYLKNIKQNITFSLSPHQLSIESVIEGDAKHSLSEAQVVMQLLPDYDEWFVNEECGSIDVTTHEHLHAEIALPLAHHNAFIALASSVFGMPALGVYNHICLDSMSVHLFNTTQQKLSRCFSVIKNNSSMGEATRFSFVFMPYEECRAVSEIIFCIEMLLIFCSIVEQSISNEHLFIFYGEKGLQIWRKGVLITRGHGIEGVVHGHEFLLKADSANITQCIVEDNKLVLLWDNKTLGSRYVVVIALSRSTCLISTHLQFNDIKKRTQRLTLFVSQEFKSWMQGFKEGVFQDSVSDHALVLSNDEVNSETQFFALKNDSKQIGFLINCQGENAVTEAAVQSSWEDEIVRALSFASAIENDETSFAVSLHFDGGENLYKMRDTILFPASITTDKLKLLCFEHSIRIYVDGRELTSGEGLHFVGITDERIEQLRFVDVEKVDHETIRLIALCNLASNRLTIIVSLVDDTIILALEADEAITSDFSLQMGMSVSEEYQEYMHWQEGEAPIWKKLKNGLKSIAHERKVLYAWGVRSENNTYPVLCVTDANPSPATVISYYNGYDKIVETKWNPFSIMQNRRLMITIRSIDSPLYEEEMKTLAERKKRETYEKEAERTIFRQDSAVTYSAHGLSLLHKQEALTSTNGITFNYTFAGSKYNFDTFIWRVAHKSFEFLELEGYSKNRAIRQRVSIKWLHDEELEVVFGITALEEEGNLENVSYVCLMDESYREWLLGLISGKITEENLGNELQEVPVHLYEWDEEIGCVASGKPILIMQNSTSALRPAVYIRNKESARIELCFSVAEIPLKKNKECVVPFTMRVLPKTKREDWYQTKKEAHTIVRDDLHFEAYNHAFRLFFKDKQITRQKGFDVLVTFDGKSYDALRFPLEIAKQSENELQCVTHFPFGKQYWSWQIQSGHVMRLDIDFDEVTQSKVTDVQLVSYLAEDSYKNNCLLNDDNERHELGQDFIYDHFKGNFRLVFDDTKDENLPIALGGGFNVNDIVYYEIGSDEGQRAKTIKLTRSVDSDSVRSTFLFECGLLREYGSELNMIEKNTMVVWVRNETTLLKVAESAITHGMGLYTAFFVPKIGWHDCVHNAIRQAKKDSPTRLRVRVKWEEIPLVQYWTLELVEAETLKWTLSNEVQKKIVFKKEQINVMLSPSFVQWQIESKKGIFPPSFSQDYGGDWDSVACAEDVTSACSLKCPNGLLPAGKVCFLPHLDGFKTKIINSDDMFQARVIQCSRHGDITYERGEHEVMSVVITMEAEKYIHENPTR